MKKWFILHRTGNVFTSFNGTDEEVTAELSRLNATDEQGTTEIVHETEDKKIHTDVFYDMMNVIY